MRKLFAALAAVCLLSTPVYAAQKTQAQLSSEILSNFPTCGTGCISAANLRAVMQDVVDSFFNVLSAQAGHVFLASPSDGTSGNPTYRNITGSDLPNPSATTLGGVQSAGPTASQWINSISTSGVPALSQPGFTDLSGSLASSQMPALTGDVTSSAGSTVTTIPAGSISNSKLATMGTVTLKGNLTGGTASPSDVAPSAVLDTFGSAQGTVIFRGASGWSALPPGSNGQVFTTGGASANPSWVTVGGTGTVTSVTCGTGLTGGTITITGTCALSTPVTVGNGGIGVGTLTAHGILLGEGTSAITPTAVMTNGQLLIGQSAADPLPKTVSGDCTMASSGAITCTTLNGVTMAPLASPGLTGTPTAPTATAGTNTTQIATTAFVTSAVTAGVTVPVRQTVLSGPTASGLPSFLPTTSGTLSITSQNVSTGAASLIVTAANGFGANGGANVIGVSTSNLTWSGLTASTTNFLGVTISGGTLTTLSTTTAPIYQCYGTISVTSGQYTFDYCGYQMYLGNGSTAAAVSVVFVGEAVTSGSGVTSTVAYAYQGYYDSGLTNTLPGSGANIVKNANIGVTPQQVRVIAQNLTAEGNFSVGDQVSSFSVQYSGTSVGPLNIGASRNTVFFTTGAAAAQIFWLNKTTGAVLTPTAANWAYKIVASRGW